MIERYKNKIYTLLRFSEHYTKTDMVYLAKGGSWLTGGHMITSLIAFLMSIAFANLIPKETYGTYRFVISLASVFGAFTLSGLGTALTKAVAGGHEKTLKPAFREALLWSTPMFLISIGTAVYYFINGDMTLGISFIVIALLNPIFYSAGLYSSFLNGKKQFKKTSVYNIFISVGSSVVLLIVLLLTQQPLPLVVAYFVTHTLLTLFFYIKTARKINPESIVDETTYKYGKWLSGIQILNTVANQLDKVLIFHFLGAAQVAIYFFAINIPDQISGVFKNLYALAFPKFVERPLAQIQKQLIKKMFLFGLVLAITALVYILIAPIFFKIFFPQYSEAVAFSQILAITIITSMAALPTAVLHAKGAVKYLYVAHSLTAIIRIVLLLVLIASFGVWGVVLAVVIAKIFDVLVLSVAAKRLRGSGPTNVIPTTGH